MQKRLAKMMLIALAATGLMFGCASAGSPAKNEPTVIKVKEADFKSEDGLLKINNNTSSDVAIFAGRVEKTMFIGAIKAHGSRRFDLKKINGLPKKGAFLFRATTYAALDKKGTKGITEEDVIFTGLVAYDQEKPDKVVEQDIYKSVDDAQSTFVIISNFSKYILEMRLDASDGEKVAILSPGQRNKQIWIKPNVEDLPYTFFPTYVYVDPNSGELHAMADKAGINGERFEPQTTGSGTNVYSFYGPGDASGIQYNVAFIMLQNDTDELANFMTAKGNYRKNDRGTKSTSRGESDIYQIAADTGPSGKLYSNLGILLNTYYLTLNPTTVLPGHKYNLLVTKKDGSFHYKMEDLGVKSKVEDAEIDLFNEYQ